MNETEIPTPRTDAEAVRGRSTAFPRASYFVDADFARQLERENAVMRHLAKNIVDAYDSRFFRAGQWAEHIISTAANCGQSADTLTESEPVDSPFNPHPNNLP